ncbi:MAG: type VI secretion system baseplate subunit TssK [Bryobacterales bacterium]|jgi:type VI secretion system protein ImpJ|nr:type VI secretion system baseplate subunit TssK [Bryobacterales bacterium]
MKQLSKVVWAEGMYLGPHHFQAQNRYLEDAIHFTAESLFFEGFGFAGLQLDADALRNGTLSMLHARGLTHDGVPFQMPEADPVPPTREIKELFPPTSTSLMAYLAIPEHKENDRNCVLPGDAATNGARYFALERKMVDEVSGRDEKPVFIGKKNFCLLLETENLAGYEVLPMARILRDGAGNYIFDSNFMPPLLDISASETLLMIVRRLSEMMEEKSRMLSGELQTGSRFQQSMSGRDIATFWFLHAIHTAIPAFRHLFRARRGHPELLYQEMARLAGALCTFGTDTHPRQLPLYDHRNPEVAFLGLDEHIRRHLEYVVPSNVIHLKFRQTKPNFWSADVSDDRCFGRSRWVFGIHARVGEADLIRRTDQLVKVCSEKFVPELVRRALPGLPMQHLSVPPAAVRQKVEAQYFSLTKTGPCWDHLTQTKVVGVYVPSDIPDPEIEVQVILDSGS